MKNPANKLVLRLNSFCTQFMQKYVKVGKPANLDFYVLASSSVKLIWKSSADESVKACASGRIVANMSQSAAAICKDYHAIGKIGDKSKGIWTQRSIHLLQLATQLLNHPGTSGGGGVPTLPPGVTRISIGACPALSDFSVADSLAALVFAAASVDALVHKTNCSTMYLHMKTFLSLQFSAGRHPEHGIHDDSDPQFLLAHAFLHLSRLSAISSIPKLGGYSLVQLSTLKKLCQHIQECQEAAPLFIAEVNRHEAWCSNLQPVLEGSMEVFVSEGKQHAREAFWVSGPRPANVSSSEGQMDAQEVSICDLNELRQRCIKGPDAWKAALSKLHYGGSHPEIMAACKLVRHCADNKRSSMLEAILENKTRPQWLAGLEVFSSPQVIAPMSDSHWDNHMRHIARQPFSGLQQDLKMVCLSANTCAKLLQAARRLHISFLRYLRSRLPGPSRSTMGSIEPSALDPSPVASGPADSKAAAERHEGQSSEFQQLAGATCFIWEYCIEAGHKVAQSDADVVWDLCSTPGLEDTLLRLFRWWLGRKAVSQQALRQPSPTAFQHLLDEQLAQLRWGNAAIVALHYAVDHLKPAQAELALALDGVRKEQGLDAPQQLPTVCQGQYADGRPCTASAKKHGYCLRHQKQANVSPCNSKENQLTVESLLGTLRDEGHMDTSSQKLAVAKAVDYTAAAEVAFVLELYPQTAPATFMLTILEKVCEYGDLELAVKLLQEKPQIAARNMHVYRILLGRLRPVDGAMELVQRSLTVSAAGNAVMSGLVRACSTSTDSDAAWALYQDAHSYGYMLHVKAQQVLWKLQSDERLLQLHAHFKSGIGPLVAAPSTHTLAEVAAVYIVHANWDAAVAIAQELPAQEETAKIVSGVVQGVERSNGSLMKVALPWLHMLYETQRHADVVKVFSAVQAHNPSCITPEHLHVGLLAWLQLNDPTAATAALQRHYALAFNWTAPQQQTVFQDALAFCKACRNEAALPLLQSISMAGLKAKLPLAPMQAHELVMAMLSLGQTENACQVSIERL
ncbi:TPA: hypothetical protein ACH3X3_011149 [Trebouxia sp. C0006]